jgi:hypothetical protein
MDPRRWVADYSGRLLSTGKNPDEDLGGRTRTGSHLVMDTVDVVETGHVGSVAPSQGIQCVLEQAPPGKCTGPIVGPIPARLIVHNLKAVIGKPVESVNATTEAEAKPGSEVERDRVGLGQRLALSSAGAEGDFQPDRHSPGGLGL